MPDTPLSVLNQRQQKLLTNARRALEKGNPEYVVTVCGEILQAHPGCWQVRQLQRTAQLRLTPKASWMGRKLSGLTQLPFALGSKGNDPEKNLAKAEKLVADDPRNVVGLSLLAKVARLKDWPETVIFALEAIREIEPEDRENLLALGEACLTAGKPVRALQVADELLAFNSVDGDAQALMRQASIARTTTEGRWEGKGDYREKLKDEAESNGLEKKSVPTEVSSQPEKEVKEAVTSEDPLTDARGFVARYPGDLEGRFRLAGLLFESGEIESAIAEYQQTQKNPKLRGASLLGLGRCFRQRGLLDLAVGQLTTAKGELGPMNDLKKEIIYELGESQDALGQGEKAIEQFKEIYTEDIGFRDVAAKVNAYYASK